MAERSAKAVSDDELNSNEPGKGLWLLVGLIILIISAFVFLRTTPTHFGSEDELVTVLTDGQPTIIEFYSNF